MTDNILLVHTLMKKELHISAAESCTGGLFSALITAVPGSSEIMNESVVTYSNEAKMKYLGVKKGTLDKYGAVSAPTAYEMAEGIVKQSGADVGVSITGIAGPGGGTPQKPVGTVFAGINIKGRIITEEYHIDGDRETVRRTVCLKVMKKILEII